MNTPEIVPPKSSLPRRAAEVAVMAFEVTPANEVARLGALALSQQVVTGPISAAVAYGGATMLIEGSAAAAAASWLTRPKSDAPSGKVYNWVDDKVDKVIPRDAQMNVASQAGVAFLGGSAVLLWAHDRQNPDTTQKQKRNFGLKMSAGMAAVCAGQGALMAEGISSPDPKSIGIGLLAFAGVPAIAGKLKNRFKKPEVVEAQNE